MPLSLKIHDVSVLYPGQQKGQPVRALSGVNLDIAARTGGTSSGLAPDCLATLITCADSVVQVLGAATGHVTSHEAQARNAEGCHVDVVTRLVGLLAFGVEVGTSDGVGQEHSAATIYAVAVVAVTGDFLGCQ